MVLTVVVNGSRYGSNSSAIVVNGSFNGCKGFSPCLEMVPAMVANSSAMVVKSSHHGWKRFLLWLETVLTMVGFKVLLWKNNCAHFGNKW